jgi:hypothetical protein
LSCTPSGYTHGEYGWVRSRCPLREVGVGDFDCPARQLCQQNRTGITGLKTLGEPKHPSFTVPRKQEAVTCMRREDLWLLGLQPPRTSLTEPPYLSPPSCLLPLESGSKVHKRADSPGSGSGVGEEDWGLETVITLGLCQHLSEFPTGLSQWAPTSSPGRHLADPIIHWQIQSTSYTLGSVVELRGE